MARPTSPAPAMLVAHALAVVVGAIADRGGGPALPHGFAGRPGSPACRRPADTGQAGFVVAERRSAARVHALLLAASVSHRGPPVSLRQLTVHSPNQESDNRMRFPSRAPTRALFTVACTGAALSIGLASGAGPACAHVHADADNAAPGITVGGHLPGTRRIRKWLSDNQIERQICRTWHPRAPK